MKSIFLVLALAAFVAVKAEFTSYEGFKVYNIPITSEDASQLIGRLNDEAEAFGADFWTSDRAVGRSNDVMVAPFGQKYFERILTNSGIAFEVVIPDMQSYLDSQDNIRSAQTPLSTDALDLSRYYQYEEIVAYLQSIAQKFPERVSLGSAGTSYEGRDIPIVVIDNGDNNRNKTTIFIDAGVHAREWIAPATALYLIEQLTENAAAHQDILADLNWIIIPVVNPDGYKYTFTNSRMWRKTRRPVGAGCSGVDGNRNYAYEWGGEGASPISCMDTYRGPAPFSEPETQAVERAVAVVSDVVKFYASLHSYGSYLLYPWGYNTEKTENWQEIEALCKAGAAAVKSATGNDYQIGPSGALLYPAAGGSDDWAHGSLKVPYAITVELPRGGSGFDPPPSAIDGLVKESFVLIEGMARHLRDVYNKH